MKRGKRQLKHRNQSKDPRAYGGAWAKFSHKVDVPLPSIYNEKHFLSLLFSTVVRSSQDTRAKIPTTFSREAIHMNYNWGNTKYVNSVAIRPADGLLTYCARLQWDPANGKELLASLVFKWRFPIFFNTIPVDFCFISTQFPVILESTPRIAKIKR